MEIYIILFLYLIISAFSLYNQKNSVVLRMTLVFFSLILALRTNEVGSDTGGYVGHFIRFSRMSFRELAVSLVTAKEPLYFIFTWLVGCVSDNRVAYLFFWGVFPCVAIYYSLKDEVKTVNGQFLSILCLFILGLFAFFIAGIRQTAAVSVVLLAYKYLTQKEINWNFSFFKSKQFLYFVLLMFIAYNLHNSSLLFFLALPILKMPIGRWSFFIVIALFFIGSFVKVGFLTEIAALFFDDRFGTYGTVYESSQSISAFLMQFILYSICFVKHTELINRDPKNRYLFNIILLGMVFQAFSGLIYEMARVSFYFSIFAMVLVPKAFEEYSINVRKPFYILFTISVIFYLFFLSSANLPIYTSILFK